MNFTDRTLTCADCGMSFIFSAGDQAFHQEKGFTNEPRRCQNCRTAKRAERGGGGSYSGGSSYGGGYGGQREMFSVICSQCGKEAQVPFQPTGSRPVYCSDCFRSQRSSGGYGDSGYGSSSRGGGNRGGYGGGGYDRRY